MNTNRGGLEMDVTVMETPEGFRLMCEWFVMCDRPAEWAAQGPEGMVPVCQRCADHVGMGPTDLVEYELSGEG